MVFNPYQCCRTIFLLLYEHITLNCLRVGLSFFDFLNGPWKSRKLAVALLLVIKLGEEGILLISFVEDRVSWRPVTDVSVIACL
jgi:hypothetical protein